MSWAEDLRAQLNATGRAYVCVIVDRVVAENVEQPSQEEELVILSTLSPDDVAADLLRQVADTLDGNKAGGL